MRLAIMTAVLVASTSVALAQSTPSPGGLSPAPGGPAIAPGGVARPGGTGGPGITAPPHVPAINPLTTEDVQNITGTKVYGSDDAKLGSVSHELMDPGTKKIDRLVVAEGGLLGVGSHNVALPLNQFKWDQQKESFTIDKTADDLKAMPAWQKPSQQAMSEPAH